MEKLEIKQSVEVEKDKEKIEQEQRLKLIEDFDELHPELKEALANSPEIYENIREEFINMQLEMARSEAVFDQEMEEFNTEMERAVQEKREAKIDSVTKLEQRPGLYRTMNQSLQKVFSPEVLNDREAFLAAVEEGDFTAEDLYIAFGDVSFLSLANKAGHDQGDKLLAAMAAEIKNQGEKSVRYGGDELATFYNDNEDKVRESLQHIQNQVENLENVANLKQYGLKSNIDFGVARFSEAVAVFKELMRELRKNSSGEKIFEALDVVNEIQDIWVKIADQRAALAKGKKRIPLLLEIKKNYPKVYKEVIGSLKKGAYDATERDLKSLEKLDEEKQALQIKDFIIKKEEAISASKEGYDRWRSELILKKALENF